MSQIKEDMDTITALVCVNFFFLSCFVVKCIISLSVRNHTLNPKTGNRYDVGSFRRRGCRRLEELSKAGYVLFSALSISLFIFLTYYYINNIISCCTHFVYTTWYFRIRVFLRSSGRIIRWNSERDD